MSAVKAGLARWSERGVRLLEWLASGAAGRWAWKFWAVFVLVLVVMTAVAPDRRTVTPNYRQAAERWFEGRETLYFAKKKGFLYLPHAALIYAPFAALPKRVGEPLWRAFCVGLLVWALWGAARTFAVPGRAVPFGLLTALVIPSSFASAANGQMNIPLAAAMLLAATALARGQPWRAALWLLAGVAMKPPGIVPLLLVGAMVPALWLRLGVLVPVFLALPFLHPDPGYVAGQYKMFWEVLRAASAPVTHEFCDLAGMFRTFGLPWPEPVGKPVRAAAALVTLGVAWVGWRRWRGRGGAGTIEGEQPGDAGNDAARDALWAPVWVMALAAVYLMLFNPRTEANSYIVLSPFVALAAWRALGWEGRRGVALGLAVGLFFLGCDSYGPLHGLTNLWLKALLASGFAVYLVREILRRPRADARGE